MTKVILLPGMDGSGIMFEPLLETLPEKINCETLTLAPGGDQSYSTQARLIAEAIGDDEVVIFAESYSGHLAFLIHKLKPKNIKHIIFAASFLTNPSILTELAPLLPIGILKSGLIPNSFLHLMCFNNSAHPKAIDCLNRSLQTVSIKVLKQRLRNIASLKSTKQKIEIPCTYILPSNDYLVSKKAVNHLMESCRDLKVVNLKGGHFIAQSNVVGCSQVISDAIFLANK